MKCALININNFMAKRQSSLIVWLSNMPSKTARISDESESDNYEYSEMDYLSDSSSMSEADKAESSSDTTSRLYSTLL